MASDNLVDLTKERWLRTERRDLLALARVARKCPPVAKLLSCVGGITGVILPEKFTVPFKYRKAAFNGFLDHSNPQDVVDAITDVLRNETGNDNPELALVYFEEAVKVYSLSEAEFAKEVELVSKKGMSDG